MVKVAKLDLDTLSHDELLAVVLEASKRAERLRIERNKLSRRVKELESQVFVDMLTGVGNRGAFEKALRNELARARRGIGKPVSLAIFDLDHFKVVNDTYGHPVGDLVLRKTGELLRKHARSTDFVGRIGGEEFVFILPGTSADQAYRFVERFRQVLVDGLVVVASRGKHLTKVRATASFGLATWEEKESGEILLARADAALYLAKQGGRNKVHVALPPDGAA